MIRASRRTPRTMFAATIIVAATRSAMGDVLVLDSVRDNTLYQDDQGLLSNGSGEHLFAGNNGTGLSRRGLIRFDFAELPDDAVITSVTLSLHVSLTGAGPVDIALHRVLGDWGEGLSDAPGNEGGGAPAAIGDATWLHTFYNTSTWSNVGGDFNADTSAITPVDAIGFYSWSSSAMIDDVQSWIDNPLANFGWLLRGDESTSGTTKRFDSRENINPAFRPTLTVQYVPGPGVLPLLAAAGVLLTARRRRG